MKTEKKKKNPLKFTNKMTEISEGCRYCIVHDVLLYSIKLKHENIIFFLISLNF